jgi:hypothetical protein
VLASGNVDLASRPVLDTSSLDFTNTGTVTPPPPPIVHGHHGHGHTHITSQLGVVADRQ